MELLTLILAGVALLFGIRYFFFRKPNKFDEYGIPYKKPFPIFGNFAASLFRWKSIPELVNEIYRESKDADYVGFFEFSEPLIMIKSPELIKSITVKNFDHFVDHRGFVNMENELFGRNLFALRGEKWREIRNLLTPAFTGSKMKLMFKLMSTCGKNFAEYFAQLPATERETVNTKDAFTRYTTDAIATCAFGISVDSLRNPKNDFYVLGKRATNFNDFRILIKLLLLRNFPKVYSLLRLRFFDAEIEDFFVNVVTETIETRDREGISRPDMIQLMMESRGKKEGEGPNLSMFDMTAQAFVFFFGGFDSSSTAMCFTAYSIAVNDDVQKKLQNEIDEVYEASNGDPTYEAINSMEYLDAVISESLRMYPILGFIDRQCVKKFELPPPLPGGKNVIVEPGETISLPIYSLHTDEKYHPDPFKFDPERFMGENRSKIEPFTYFPFGQGPRMCIGNRFALLEIKVVLFYLLSKCNFKPSSKTLVPLEFSKKSFAMTAKNGFWLRFETRTKIVN